MKSQEEKLTDAAKLRQEAEERLKSKQLKTDKPTSEADMLKLIHELEVHQIELKMQNEELALAQENAEIAKEKYTELYDFAPSGYLSLSKDGMILELNFAASKMLGKERSLLIKKQFAEFISDKTKPIFNSFFDKVFATDEKQTCELTITTQDNEPIYVNIYGVASQNEEYCLLTMVDITENKQNEQALKESEEKLKEKNFIFNTLMDNLTQGVFMVEAPTGKPILANKAAYDILGRGILPDTNKKNLQEVYQAYKEDTEQPYPPDEMPIIRGMNGEKSHIDNMVIKTSTGKKRHIEVFGSPVYNDKGEVWASIASFTDITDRKLIDLELLENRQRLEFALQGGRLGVWDWNVQTGKVVYSDLWAKILEYSSEEVETNVDFFKNHIHPDDKAAVLDRLMGHIDGRFAMYESEHRFRTKSGKWLWIQDRGKITEYDDEGNPVRATGIISDISDRKKAEESLRESEEKYKALFRFLPFGISLTDKKGSLIENNEEAKRLLGLGQEELLKRQINGDRWNIIRPDGTIMPDNEYASVKALKENRRVENVVMGIVKPDNDTTWITVTAEPFRYGDYGVVISYLDITKMVLAEKELKRNEDRLKTIVKIIQNKTDSIQEFLNHTLDKAVEFTDSQMGYIFIYDDSKKELLLNSWSKEVMNECTLSDEQIKFQLENTGIMGEAIRKRKPIIINDYQAENVLKKGYPEGHLNLENFLSIPVFSLDKIVASVAVANKKTDYNKSDVLQLTLLMESVWRTVERKQEEEIKAALLEEISASKDELEQALFQKNALLEELSESEAKLRESISAKDKFFSIIAHDLKSPFSGFIGLTDVLAKEYDEISIVEMQKIAKAINDSANSIYKLLNDLLQWSRTQIGTVTINKEELDFYEIVFNTVFLLKELAQEKEITVDHSIKPDTILECDRNMTVTILRNLVTNSIKFSEPGGRIEIGLIENNNTIENSFIKIFVKDNGIGIPDEQIERIFSIGHNFIRTGTENEHGTGLGLILCKEFVEMHGGEIWVESEVGKGSTFYFTLPLSKEQ